MTVSLAALWCMRSTVPFAKMLRSIVFLRASADGSIVVHTSLARARAASTDLCVDLGRLDARAIVLLSPELLLLRAFASIASSGRLLPIIACVETAGSGGRLDTLSRPCIALVCAAIRASVQTGCTSLACAKKS